MSSNKSKKSVYDGKLFYAKTSVVVPIKTTFEVMSGILVETVVYVTAPNPNKPNDFAGLEIATTDGVKNVFIRVNMDADKFDDFYCKPEKTEFGICIQTLNEALRIVEKNNNITMYIEENDTHILTIEIDDEEEDEHTLLQIDLFDFENKYKEKSSKDFDIEIVTDGIKFHRLIKDFGRIAEHIDLKCTSKNLIYSGVGKLKRSTTKKINNGSLTIKKDDSKHKIVQGIYDIENIVLFTKCANLCNDISIYMKNNFALTIAYKIPKYGTFTVAFTPIVEEIIKSGEYMYSDNEEEVDVISNEDNVIKDYDDSDEELFNKHTKINDKNKKVKDKDKSKDKSKSKKNKDKPKKVKQDLSDDDI